MKPANRLFLSLPPSIFAHMSAMANEYKAINLGQGFPDTDGPEWVRKEAADSIMAGPNQYAPALGIPALREAVAAADKRFYGLDTDAKSETLITSGASEALLDCFAGLLNPGDEAIVIEPFFDIYVPQILMTGAKPRFIRLQLPDWKLDEAELRAAFSEKTKLLVLNTPMNPACKVFTRAELEAIARLLEEFDAYAVCDEVYEHMTYDGHRHIPLMALPGMKKRCLRIGSAGKTFSLTGWKVGYVSAQAELLKPIAAAHQNATFATPPALQSAVAKGLAAGDDYYAGLAGQMNEGRIFLTEALKKVGFNVLPCEGTYFLVADFAPLGFKGNDVEFCEWMTKEGGVTAIPMSAFYSPENGPPPHSLIRFCFAKKRGILQEAVERMTKFF